MKRNANEPRTVIVTGDATVDWNIAAAAPSGAAGWRMDQTCRVFRQNGGAALLGELIAAMTNQLPANAGAWESRRALPARGWRSYSLWSQFPYADGQRGAESAWRLRQHLGLDPEPTALSTDAASALDGKDSDGAVVVITDDALGFRNQPDAWPASLRVESRPSWIVWKTSGPLLDGELWQHLHRHHADRLIVVLSADVLRDSDLQISRGLSWEQTAQDALRELLYDRRVSALAVPALGRCGSSGF